MENLKGIMFLVIFMVFVFYAKKYDNKKREVEKKKDSIEYRNDTLNNNIVIKY